MERFEYDNLIFLPVKTNEVEKIEMINNEMLEVMANKELYIAPTKEYILKCIEKKIV